MAIQIAPMLAVSSGQAAIDYYRAAFGAKLLWQVKKGEVVAGLEFGGALPRARCDWPDRKRSEDRLNPRD